MAGLLVQYGADLHGKEICKGIVIGNRHYSNGEILVFDLVQQKFGQTVGNHLKCMQESGWSPEYHYLYSTASRQTIETLFLIQKHGSIDFIPVDILVLIIRQILSLLWKKEKV